MASVLFALHPTHAEPVAWVAALSELGYTFFLLVGLYFYVQEDSPKWSSVLALSSYAMALLWKESALAFIPLIVLWDILVVKRWQWKLWLAAIAVTLAYLSVRILALGGLAPSVLYPGLTVWTQVLTALSNVGFYVEKLVWPVGLSAVYGTEFATGINTKIVVVLVLVALGVWKLRGRLAWSALWVVAGLSPVLLVSRIAVPLADRDLYLPSIGFAWLLAVFLDSARRRIAIPVVAALAISSGALLVQQLPVWRDDIPLFKHALEQQPDSSSIRLLLASELARRMQFDEALRYLDEVLLREPDNLKALVDQAGVQLSAQNFAGVRSTCAKVLEMDPKSARCWYNMGYLEEVEGKLAQAHEKFALAFKLNPGLSQALLHQGLMEARTGNLEAARKTLEIAVQRLPTAPALNNLGTVYAERGELKKAVSTFEAALRVDPSFELARRNLERARADSR
jgi:Flp pilus assembly protein TadD